MRRRLLVACICVYRVHMAARYGLVGHSDEPNQAESAYECSLLIQCMARVRDAQLAPHRYPETPTPRGPR